MTMIVMSTEEPPTNSFERNYYDRTSSRLVSQYQPSNSASLANSNSHSSPSHVSASASVSATAVGGSSERSRNRDRLYRNGSASGHSGGNNSSGNSSNTTTTTAACTAGAGGSGPGGAGGVPQALGDRSSSHNIHQNQQSARVAPPQSWYEAAAGATTAQLKSPGGSGNAGASAAGGFIMSSSPINHHQHQHPHLQNSQHPHYSSLAAGAVGSCPSPAQGQIQIQTQSQTTAVHRSVAYAGSAADDSLTTATSRKMLLNSSKLNKLLKGAGAAGSGEARSGSESPGGAAATPSITTSTITNNSFSSNSLNNTITTATPTMPTIASGAAGSIGLGSGAAAGAGSNTTSGSVSGDILNVAAALAAAVDNGISTNPIRTRQHMHGRSTTSSSRSHSRSPSSYSSSHSSSSSSHSSSHSHASSPVQSTGNCPLAEGRSARTLQSVAVSSNSSNPSSNVANATSAGGGCGSSSSSSSSSTSSGSSSCLTGNPVVHSEDNRPLAIRVRNLPARSSDTSLKDGLFHEYKKHGKVTWVKVVGQNSERYALVCFKKPDDVEKALEVSHDKHFFGCKIEVEPYQGYDVEDNEFRPYEAELDEYHPKSTRTLFIGNLEKDITAGELRGHFEGFGEIIEIDIKKQGLNAYAFCQYSDIVSVVKAMRKMDGEHLGSNRIKLGFGKSMPTNCVWIDGVSEKVSESFLQSQFTRFGTVTKVSIDRTRQLALVLYDQVQNAQAAVKDMRGTIMRGRKLQVDFASRECQDAFYDKQEKQQQQPQSSSSNSRFSRYESTASSSQSRSRASSFSRHQNNSNDSCSPSNTPGGVSSGMASGSSTTNQSTNSIITSSIGIIANSAMPAPSLASGSVNSSGNTSGTVPAAASMPLVASSSSSLMPMSPAALAPRHRMVRNARQTVDFDFNDVSRLRFRNSEEVAGSAGNPTQPEEVHSDSPVISRQGTAVNCLTGSVGAFGESVDGTLNNSRIGGGPCAETGGSDGFTGSGSNSLSRRRCEQLEECPSSGDEGVVSPRKRIKIDYHHHHHHSNTSGLESSNEHMSINKPSPLPLSNCDVIHDPLNRKSEIRRVSETPSGSLSMKFPGHLPSAPPSMMISCRRPSIDVGALSALSSSSAFRHGIVGASSMDQQHIINASLAAKRRRVTTTMQQPSSSLTSGTSSGSVLGGISSLPQADDFHHHVSRGRGHQLHSHHSHEASGGESADGSRPGTPLCDERPEVLPTEPRRLPPPRERTRERVRDVMLLPLPKFGVLFFQQQQSRSSGCGTGNSYLQQQLGGGSSGGLGGLGVSSSSSCSLNNSSLNASQGMGCSGSTFLPSPSSRYWRSSSHHQHHQHNHQQQSQQLHGSTSSNSGLMASPARPRSLSSNSSDSDVPGQNAGGSPSLDERLRNFEENYERWSGGSSREHVSGHTALSATPTWQLSMHMNLGSGLSSHQTSSASGNSNSSSGTVSSSTSNSRHKFLDIDELQPSDIVKSVLAKKSVFDDDLKRLNKNQWYDPASCDFALGSSSNTGVGSSSVSRHPGGPCSGNTSPALPNLSATKTTTIIGSCSSGLGNSTSCKTAGLLQRLSSLSPMNSPQASMSPYNSPSPSPSVGPSANLGQLTKPIPSGTVSGGTSAASSSPAATSGPTKGLQYPFPSHPPLPNTAAPPPAVQPAPPPPPEMGKQSRSAGQASGGNLTKSLSVPDAPQPSAPRVQLQKSASVPGSTNMGTPISSSSGSVTASSSTPASISSSSSNGNSSSATAATHVQKLPQPTFSEEEQSKKSGFSSSQSSSSSSKKITSSHDKLHSKHNNRSDSDKKNKKSEKHSSSASVSDKRKNSGTSQSSKSATPRIEDDSSEPEEPMDKSEKDQRHEREKKDRQEKEKREKDLRKQLEREEKERKAVQEEREREDRKVKEEKEMEKEREKRAQEDRQKKEREEQELREKEQREKAQKEREIQEKELHEKAQREKEQRGKELRDEQREKELHRDKDQRDREHREKEQPRRAVDTDQEARICKMRELSSYQKSKTDSTAESTSFYSQNNIAPSTASSDCQHNKENAVDVAPPGTPIASPSTPADSASKNRSRKLSRNSPVRLHKRRLSSQESNHSAGGGVSCQSSSHQNHNEDYVKRIRMETSQNSNQRLNDRRDSKEHKSGNSKEEKNSSSHISKTHSSGGSSFSSSKHHRRDKHHQKSSVIAMETNPSIEMMVDTSSQTKQHLNTSEEEQHPQPKKEKARDQPSSQHHGSSSSSRHKSKRDHHHHREKKRHSLAESTNTDEEHTPLQHNLHRRISAAGSGSAGELSSAATNTSSGKTHHHHRRSVERKSSRGSDEGHNSSSKLLRAKLMMLSSADSDDSDDASKKHSIFDIPDDCPNVSMYDKVKARSCKNMQRQAEEKKIKAKFSQLKQSRAKKKRSTSYDGDSDTEFEDRHHRNSGSSSFHGRYPGLSSSDDDHDEDCHQRRISSDSDAEHGDQDHQDAGSLPDANRLRQMQQNLRRLCDGDDSSEDEIRRNVMKHSHLGKRNSHSTRIASDSESQSLPAPDLAIKQEPSATAVLEIKTEQLSDNEQKFKSRHDSNSSIDERNLKTESEVKKELGDFYNSAAYNYVDSGKLKDFSPETRKKHKKSKRRLKSSSTAETSAPPTPLLVTPTTPSIFDVHSSSECKTKFDSFDDLKTESTSISLEVSASERRKHKERKEKKREKLRNITEINSITTIGNSPTSNDLSSEKLSKEERHRLKKSKKSKSLDTSSTTKIYNSGGAHHTTSPPTPTSAPLLAQTSKRGDDKMEFIFGIISDEDESQFPEQVEINKDVMASCVSTTGPIVSAALQTYKQEPSTPTTKNQEALNPLPVQKDEHQQHLERSRQTGGSSSSSHADRERHRKEKREKKRREKTQRELQHQAQQQSAKVETKVDDDNSVDMDEAGRALEAQLMIDFDSKTNPEEVTPSTAATYRSDMADVFRFSDNEDNQSVEIVKQGPKQEQQEQHKSKDKKKKKKRSKEEKQEKLMLQHRRESLPSVAPTLSAPPTPGKLTVNVQAASKHAEEQLDSKLVSSPPLCKPSPSLPCLLGDDDEDLLTTPKGKPQTPTSRGSDSLTPSREKPRLISPIPKTPTITNSSMLSTQSAETPVSSGAGVNSSSALATTPTSSTAVANSAAVVIAAAGVESSPTSVSSVNKKKDIFIPGFDGQMDDRISESAVQSISAEFTSSVLDNLTDEPKIPVASPPCTTKIVDKLEDSKSRVTISQEETESAVSALLGESFGTSSTADYSLDGMDEMNSVSEIETPALVIAEPDEEAALAAKAIEAAGEPAAILEEPEMEPETEPEPEPEPETESERPVEVLDPDEINKAVQSLRHEDMMDIKADTPQSERDLQIDTDTEENPDEADSSGPSLKIDETVQSSSSPEKSFSNTSSFARDTSKLDLPLEESKPKPSIETVPQTSVITKLPSLETQKKSPLAGSGLSSSPAKIEPPTISKLQQPLVQPVQTVLPAPHSAGSVVNSTPVISLDLSNVMNNCSNSSAASTTASASASISFGSPTPSPNIMPQASTPKQAPLTPQQTLRTQSLIMQPPTISIPEPTPHFVVPQMVLSPHQQSHHPQQPGSYMVGIRAPSPHSPLHSPGRCGPQNRLVGQLSPVGRPVVNQPATQSQPQQQHALMTSPQGSNISPLASPTARVLAANSSPTANKQINYQPRNQQQQQQQGSQQLSPKSVIDLQPSSQLMPIPVQKMPAMPVPHHPTIISKVVTVQPQQATQSQVANSPPLGSLPPNKNIHVNAQQQHHQSHQQQHSPQLMAKMSAHQQHQHMQQFMHQQMIQRQQQQHMQQQQLHGQTQPLTPAIQHQIQQQHQAQQHHQAQQQHQPQQQNQNQPQLSQQHHSQQQHQVQKQLQAQQQFNQHQAHQQIQPQQQQLNQQQQSQQQQLQQIQKLQQLHGPQQQQQSPQGAAQLGAPPSMFASQQHHPQLPPRSVTQQQHPQQLPHSPPSKPIGPVAQVPQPTTILSRVGPQSQAHQQQLPPGHQKQLSSPVGNLSLQAPLNVIPNTPKLIVQQHIVPPPNQIAQPPTSTNAIHYHPNQTKESPAPGHVELTPAILSLKTSESVSVIRTPTPTTSSAVVSPKPGASLLTEENLIKISQPKHDELIEQDSKEVDSDYWSAKEVNIDSVIKKLDTPLATKDDKRLVEMQAVASSGILKPQPVEHSVAQESSMPTPSVNVNSSNDHDTEDETETKQLPPTKPAVPTVGRPPGRGGSGKRGRQPRGAKKLGGFPLNSATATPGADSGFVLQPGDNGVQTRLRKPVTAPVTRGRKGRPPRNLLLQQQQLQQQQLDLQRKALEMVAATTPADSPPAVSIPPSPVLTAAEKKARNQALTQAQAQNQVASQVGTSQDIYEFHDDAGEEPKAKSNSTITPPTEDQRPRLILTINKTQPSIKNSTELEQPMQQQLQQPDAALQIDPIGGDSSESSNTRKSRRLQEKEDRSTVDDIIEDVVRNTNTPTGSGQQLPKGAQTPPRRSGRNTQAKKIDAALPANTVGRPRRSKDRKTIGEPPVSMIEETIAPNPTAAGPASSLLQPSEAVCAQSHLPQLDSKEVEPVPVATSIPTPVAVTVPVPAPAPVVVPSKPTIPQHPKKKAIAAAEIESYQAINSSIPSTGLPMHQTAAPATQKVTGGAADAVSKALVDPVTGVITAGMPQGKEGNLPAATAAAPANSNNETVSTSGQQQHPQQAPLQQGNLQISTTVIASSAQTSITALGKSVPVESAAATALLNKPVSVLVKGNPTSQVIQQQHQPQMVAPPKQPIVLQQNTLSTVLQHAQHSNVRAPQPLKAHVLNREKNLQQQLTPTKQPLTQPQQQQLSHSGHMLHTDSSGAQQVLQPQIIARHLQQQQQQLLPNAPPTAHSPRITGQQQQLGPGATLSPQQQPQTLVIKQTTSATPPQILHVVSSKASVVSQPQQQHPPTTSSTGAHMQLSKPNFGYTPSVLPPTSSAPVQQQQQQHMYKQANQQKGAPVQLPSHGLILPSHPGILMQQKLPAHLQPQQHQLTPSPPPGKPNPVVHGLQTGQIIPGSVGSPPPVSAAVFKSGQQQVNSAVAPTGIRTSIPNISPQGQPRVSPLVLPPGMTGVPSFDTNLHDLGVYVSGRRTQSPPPAHQQASPITPNDSTYRGVTASRDFMLYQHHLMRGGDYDDKLSNSPPLELRRPGSGPPRAIAVPHSLQSPQDRTAADSPQMAQVYVHNSRIPPAHFSEIASRGLYDSGLQLEPPPAHRPSASISVVVPPQMPAVSTGSPFIGRDGSVQPGSHLHPSKAIEMQLDEMDRMSIIAAVVKQQQEHLPTALHAGMELAAQQVPPTMAPPPGDSLITLLQRYPVMWQGLLALKTDQAAVQMHFVHGNPNVARASLPSLVETNTPLLRIAQRMRLEQTQLEGVAKKMQVDKEHCMLLALPCGRDHADVLQHSRNLQTGFITYLQQKMAAGIVNIPIPGSEQAAYVVHIFPACDFANENLERAAPDLKNRVAELAHLLIVIATV